MSDSCSAAHHKSCFTVPYSGIPLPFPLLCVATSAWKAHSSSPVCQTLGIPHPMAHFGKVGREVTGNSQCQGSHCLLLWPKPTPRNSSFPTIWFAQFTPTRDWDVLREAESSLKSPLEPSVFLLSFYINPCRQSKWRRNEILFHLGLSDAVALQAQGFQFWFGVQVQEAGADEGNTSMKRPKLTLYVLCLPVWLLSQRTQAWKQTPESSCQQRPEMYHKFAK